MKPIVVLNVFPKGYEHSGLIHVLSTATHIKLEVWNDGFFSAELAFLPRQIPAMIGALLTPKPAVKECPETKRVKYGRNVLKLNCGRPHIQLSSHDIYRPITYSAARRLAAALEKALDAVILKTGGTPVVKSITHEAKTRLVQPATV